MGVLQFPDPLAAQVLKSKYFWHRNAIDAKFGHNPSFLWRSLFSAIDLIKEGIFWRVGTGSKIGVWHDSWLHFPLF